MPKVTQLVRSGARIQAQVCLPPVDSLCCQKVLLEKQVWGWGFQSELIRIPRGKSIVICPPPPHPSARQVAGEPPTMAPSPAPGASSALPDSLPLPGAPKVALRSPTPQCLPFCISRSKNDRKKQKERRGHLKVGSKGSSLGQKIGGPGNLLQFT